MPGNQEMRTPPWLFEMLNYRYGPFQLDAAADKKNALCKHFWTEKEDGLEQPWMDGTFCNPPFAQMGRWMRKGHLEWADHKRRSCVVGLAGCSQEWFHQYAIHGMILVPNSRINFLMPDGTPTNRVMWSTMIYLFGYGKAAWGRFFVWPLNVRGEIKKFNESQRR